MTREGVMNYGIFHAGSAYLVGQGDQVEEEVTIEFGVVNLSGFRYTVPDDGETGLDP